MGTVFFLISKGFSKNNLKKDRCLFKKKIKHTILKKVFFLGPDFFRLKCHFFFFPYLKKNFFICFASLVTSFLFHAWWIKWNFFDAAVIVLFFFYFKSGKKREREMSLNQDRHFWSTFFFWWSKKRKVPKNK